jgi:hypothetical protein
MIRLLPVPLPDSGAVRVHPAPEVLPQLRHRVRAATGSMIRVGVS